MDWETVHSAMRQREQAVLPRLFFAGRTKREIASESRGSLLELLFFGHEVRKKSRAGDPLGQLQKQQQDAALYRRGTMTTPPRAKKAKTPNCMDAIWWQRDTEVAPLPSGADVGGCRRMKRGTSEKETKRPHRRSIL